VPPELRLCRVRPLCCVAMDLRIAFQDVRRSKEAPHMRPVSSRGQCRSAKQPSCELVRRRCAAVSFGGCTLPPRRLR
jgi:hypothetical protein